MSVATRSINSPALQASLEPLAVRIARAATITVLESLPSEVIDETKICLLDLIGCAFEARGLPWSRQAVGLAQGVLDGQGAAADNPEAATYMGIDVGKAHQLAFGLGLGHHCHRRRVAGVGHVVPARCRTRVCHRHVSRCGVGWFGQHLRCVPWRLDHRVGAAVVDAGAAEPVAEHRHFRGFSGDHLAAFARPVR